MSIHPIFDVFNDGHKLTTLRRVKNALRKENARAWHEVEQDFNECEYQAARDRQMRELELEDDVMSKVPIR